MTTPSQLIIPFGFCQCGCGEKAPVSNRKISSLGVEVGQPRRFIVGHSSRKRLPLDPSPPFLVEGEPCKLLPLSRGQLAVVDAADYEWLMQRKWTAGWSETTHSFYAHTSLGRGKGNISLHRYILNCSKEERCDHANRNTLDHRRRNLRKATVGQNNMNQGLRKDSTTGFKGVSFKDGRYYSRITVGGKSYYQGGHDTAELAAAARNRYLIELHGEFARAR